MVIITIVCLGTYAYAILARLHWLPVKYGNIVSTLNWQSSLSTLSPHNSQVTWPNCLVSTYLVKISGQAITNGYSRWLLIPRNKLKFTDCAFNHAAPTIWNGLPTPVTSSSTLEHFKRSLKTELYSRAFDRN